MTSACPRCNALIAMGSTGTVVVIVESLVSVNEGPSDPPKLTEVAPVKPEPEMVTVTRVLVLPEPGKTQVTFGPDNSFSRFAPWEALLTSN
jgi:hypothetical protein